MLAQQRKPETRTKKTDLITELIFANKDTQGIYLQDVQTDYCTSISNKQPNQTGAQDLNRYFSK